MTNDTPPPAALRAATSPSRGETTKSIATVGKTSAAQPGRSIARIQGSKVQELIDQMREELKAAE